MQPAEFHQLLIIQLEQDNKKIEEKKKLDTIELVSIGVGSAVILGLFGSIALEAAALKHKLKVRRNSKSNNQTKTISAIDAKWNKVEVPIKR
jgi:hypothetical protein